MRSRSRSRVVPATGVTMATSWPASRFISVLLPALGRPAMATVRPRVSTAPCSAAASTARQALLHIFQPLAQFGAGEEIDFLFGEIDGGFHVDAQRDQRGARGVHALRELALQ